MAADEEAVTVKVKSYLDKHKISSLFEDLKSKVIKELPADPIEFLISKLQALHRQKKKATSPRPATSSGIPSSRTKIQVTGTSVATGSKIKSPSTSRTVKPKTGLTSTSSPSLTKTTSGTRTRTPARPTTSGGVKTDTSKTVSTATAGSKLKSSTSSLSPRRPTTAPSTGATKASGSQTKLSSPAKPSGLRSPSKLSTSTTSSNKSTPTKTASRSGLKQPVTGSAKGGAGVLKKPTQTQTSKDKGKPPSKKVTESSQPPKTPPAKKEAPARKDREASAEEIADFFGEPKKSSGKSFQVDTEDDDELSMPSVTCEESDGESGVTSGRSVDAEACECSGVDIESLLQMRLSMKQGKSKRTQKKVQTLLHPKSSEDNLSTTPSSLGYHSGGGEGGEESEEDECVEAVEDTAALEDEGVTGLLGKHAATISKDARVDFMVLLCARCAKILTGDEPTTEMSAIVVTRGAGSDFDSASQVGSHATFPQWEVGTEADSEVSSISKWKSSSESHDSASDVTLQSRDTWGGLAPKARLDTSGVSDVESEVQLPPPPPLEGRPWKEEQSHPHDPHGWEGEQS